LSPRGTDGGTVALELTSGAGERGETTDVDSQPVTGGDQQRSRHAVQPEDGMSRREMEARG
jgi:hypothetical protein